MMISSHLIMMMMVMAMVVVEVSFVVRPPSINNEQLSAENINSIIICLVYFLVINGGGKLTNCNIWNKRELLMSQNSYVTKCSHRWCLLLLYGLQWDLIFHLGEIKLGRWRQRKHWIYVDFHPQTNFAFPRNADERKWMNGLLSPWHHSGLRLSWLFLMTRKVMHNRVKVNVL